MLILFLIVAAFPLRASANGPPPPHSAGVRIENMPENAAYVDILIQIGADDEQYTPYNVDHGARMGIPAQSPIVLYDEDGFASFTFHFAEASVDEEYGMRFARENDQYSMLLDRYHMIKVALIDSEGNVLQVSDSVDLNPSGKSGYFTGTITYDALADTIDAPYHTSPIAAVFSAFKLVAMVIMILLRMLLSSGIETLIALPFKLRPVSRVFLVNMGTQLLLYIFMAVCPLPYVWALVIGEIAVYVSEFFILRRVYKNAITKISTARLAAFVVTANTASLAVGLWINSIVA